MKDSISSMDMILIVNLFNIEIENYYCKISIFTGQLLAAWELCMKSWVE